VLHRVWTCGTSYDNWRLVFRAGCWHVTPPKPAALEAIFTEIQKAIDAQLYYLAVAVSLSVPDICVSLECDPTAIWTNKAKFIAWVANYIEPQYDYFTGADFYQLRGGVLHNGKYGHPNGRYDRLMFSLPNPRGIVLREVRSSVDSETKEVVLSLDIGMFCNSVISAARTWLVDQKDNLNVAANMPNIVRLRPEGLAPHIVGLPVIA